MPDEDVVRAQLHSAGLEKSAAQVAFRAAPDQDLQGKGAGECARFGVEDQPATIQVGDGERLVRRRRPEVVVDGESSTTASTAGRQEAQPAIEHLVLTLVDGWI